MGSDCCGSHVEPVEQILLRCINDDVFFGNGLDLSKWNWCMCDRCRKLGANIVFNYKPVDVVAAKLSGNNDFVI